MTPNLLTEKVILERSIFNNKVRQAQGDCTNISKIPPPPDSFLFKKKWREKFFWNLKKRKN